MRLGSVPVTPHSQGWARWTYRISGDHADFLRRYRAARSLAGIPWPMSAILPRWPTLPHPTRPRCFVRRQPKAPTRRAVAAPLAVQRTRDVGFIARPQPRGNRLGRGSRPPATTGTPTCSSTGECCHPRADRGWSRSLTSPTSAASRRPDRTPNCRSSATPPPTAAPFAWNGFRFRGMPIQITTPLPPVVAELFGSPRRGRSSPGWAAAVEQVVGRRWPWPTSPARRPAWRCTPFAPRPHCAGFHSLREDAPVAYERTWWPLRFLGRRRALRRGQ